MGPRCESDTLPGAGVNGPSSREVLHYCPERLLAHVGTHAFLCPFPALAAIQGLEADVFAAHTPLSKGRVSFAVEHGLPPPSDVQTTCGIPCCETTGPAAVVPEPRVPQYLPVPRAPSAPAP